MVILCTEMEVTQEDSGLTTSHHQNDEDQEQETKHVVRLIGPDAIKDEEELDEDTTKGKDSSHHHSWNRLRIYGLFWNLTGDLVGPNRMFEGSLLKAHVRSHQGEW